MSNPNLTGHACTWTETVTANGNSNATHAAEAGKTHYIAGFSCSGSTASAIDKFFVSVKDDSTTKIAVDCWAGGDTSSGPTPLTVDMSNPRRITTGNACSIVWTDAGSIDVTGTIWGFTIDD